MTVEKEVLQMIETILNHSYFRSIEGRLDAGVQRRTLNVSAWEHLILAHAQLDIHIQKRDSENPDIKYLDDDDPTNDKPLINKDEKVNTGIKR